MHRGEGAAPDPRALVVALSVVLLVALSAGCGSPGSAGPAAGAENVGPAVAAPPSAPFAVVLGTAQDGGVPHAGCDGPRCEAARRDPARRHRVASLGIVVPHADGGPAAAYLVDATPDLVDQLHDLRRLAGEPPVGGVDRTPLAGIFLTHAHMGHYLGLAHLGFEAASARGVTAWATPRMAAFLRENAPWDQLVELGNVELAEIEPGEGRPGRPVELGAGVSVASLAVPHRDEYSDTVAYVVRGPRAALLYVPDTDGWDRWPTPLEEVLAEVDVALLDGTFYSLDELPGRDVSQVRHPLIAHTVERLTPLVEGGGPRVLFIHLNHSNPALDPATPERRAIEAAGFGVAKDGRVLPL